MAEADVLPFEGEESDSPLRAGDKLRAAREAMGLDRAALALRTKINARHLAALEDSDFSSLPARIYAVGFSRTYAGAVGLDSAEIAAEVRRELDAHHRPAAIRPAYDLDIEDPAKIPSRRLAWVAAALGVALLAAGAVFWRSYFVPAVDLPPVRADTLATVTTAPELSPSASISPTAESAAGLAAPASYAPVGAEAAAPPPSPAPRASTAATRPSAPPSGVQALPSPVPERLRPLPEAAPSALPSAAAT